MEGFYEVSSCGNDGAPTVSPEGHVRRFYIAAEEILWDYAPSGKNMLTNNPLNETERWLYILNIFSENILKNDWNCVYYILSHIIAHFTLLSICAHYCSSLCSDSEEFFSTDDGRLGGKYWKVRYIGYHDDTFTSKIEQHGSEHHLGILGKCKQCCMYIYIVYRKYLKLCETWSDCMGLRLDCH